MFYVLKLYCKYALPFEKLVYSNSSRSRTNFVLDKQLFILNRVLIFVSFYYVAVL